MNPWVFHRYVNVYRRVRRVQREIDKINLETPDTPDSGCKRTSSRLIWWLKTMVVWYNMVICYNMMTWYNIVVCYVNV